MPRRRRHWFNNACYHITHRCHERQFLFRFAKYRNMYRQHLYDALKKFNVSVLAYAVTSNHVHLLIATGSRGRPQVSETLQHVHGEMGQHYNMHRRREGSFWTNRFHATWIESGVHLQRCLFYIDMNMVRNRVVEHPEHWPYGSAFELASSRQRYRIVDRVRLIEKLGLPDWAAYRKWYKQGADEVLRRKYFMERQPHWSESFAAGEAEWVESAAARGGIKRYATMESHLSWPENVKTVFARTKKSHKII